MNKIILLFTVISVVLTSCSNSKISQHAPGLKDAYKNDFLIGTALNEEQIVGRSQAASDLVALQFNAITPENVMKTENIHPEWNKYTFDLADKFVEYGQRNKMYIVGHTLVWHSQLAPFVNRISSADSLKLFMQEHIKTVAGRYSDKINCWDVVNEALNEDGTMRNSIFYRLLRDDYIVDAFRLAQAATPNSKLYYNDYNNESPAKRAGTIRLIKLIKDAGVRIDGVGIQGHWHVGKVPFKNIEQSIVEYAALGVKVAITELDLEVLPRNFQGADVGQRMKADAKSNPYINSLPDSIQQKLSDDYERLFRLFVKHKDKISRVTFWGVNDGQSWLNNWPVRGRTNYPLLFDRAFKPKPAYYRVMNLKK